MARIVGDLPEIKSPRAMLGLECETVLAVKEPNCVAAIGDDSATT